MVFSFLSFGLGEISSVDKFCNFLIYSWVCNSSGKSNYLFTILRLKDQLFHSINHLISEITINLLKLIIKANEFLTQLLF